MAKNRRRNTTGGWQGALIFFALTSFFALAGVSVASWQDGLDVAGRVASGSMWPVVSGYSVEQNTGKGNMNPAVADGTSIKFVIRDAEPGYRGKMTYTIANQGSIPAQLCSLSSTEEYPKLGDLVIKHSPPTDAIPGNGSREGTLEIAIRDGEDVDVDENRTYQLRLDLVFRQWNVVP